MDVQRWIALALASVVCACSGQSSDSEPFPDSAGGTDTQVPGDEGGASDEGAPGDEGPADVPAGSDDGSPADVGADPGIAPDAPGDAAPGDGGCKGDDDCPKCTSCEKSSGLCMPLPCPVECDEDEDCGTGKLCQKSPDGCCGHCVADPEACAAKDCVATCATDTDCPMGHECIVFAGGCCSECQPTCAVCYIEAGAMCPQALPDPPCAPGKMKLEEVGSCWFELSYTGEKGEDVILIDGCSDFAKNLPVNGCGIEADTSKKELLVACNWCGQLPYSPEYCECVPSCAGKECGPDGCGGSCGSCEAGCTCSSAGQCLGCGGKDVELVPDCVHIPTLVGAGGTIPIAVFGETAGCLLYDHVDVKTAGNAITVTVMGEDMDGLCPPCAFSYVGIVEAPVGAPGTYEVTVAGKYSGVVLASGGDIPSGACQDDCGTPLIEQSKWTLAHVSSQAVKSGCGDYYNVGSGVAFAGACQDYTVSGPDWTFETKARHCTDGYVVFGEEEPFHTEATICETPGGIHDRLMLGVAQKPGAGKAAQVFMLEGDSL